MRDLFLQKAQRFLAHDLARDLPLCLRCDLILVIERFSLREQFEEAL